MKMKDGFRMCRIYALSQIIMVYPLTTFWVEQTKKIPPSVMGTGRWIKSIRLSILFRRTASSAYWSMPSCFF